MARLDQRRTVGPQWSTVTLRQLPTLTSCPMTDLRFALSAAVLPTFILASKRSFDPETWRGLLCSSLTSMPL